MTIDLRYGDTIEQMKLIPDKSIDFICCDLPYGTTACAWDVIISFDELWKQYNRIIKDNGAIALFGNEPFSSTLRMSNVKHYKYDIIWQKEKPTNPFTIKKQFGKVHENISIFYKKTPTYNPQMSERENVTNPKPMKGDLNIDETNVISGVYKHSKDYDPYLVYPISVQKFNRDSKKGVEKLHPTQKPLLLIELLVKTYSNENDIVLDNTFGSCTTGIACINTNRSFIGIENNMDYFNISLKRVEEKRKEKEFNVVTSFGDGM
jgi:site-specific DNA-methyltransferase (adenine-specific)